ncbi:MAG: DUF4440 domain-containing protein [Gemmatimonadales bacterium]
MDEKCRKDVIELHRFFENWFTGRVARTQKEFARIRDTLAADFEIISPSGTRTRRAELLAGIWEAYGSYTSESFGIRIGNVACRRIDDDVCLVTYEEWQTRDGEEKGRVSSAVFRRREGTPGGIEWQHVHEVWIS